tara:strand:- start:2800 stop:3849 length:1050 start_codon:yes stop_codon:yes gene_type:complete
MRKYAVLIMVGFALSGCKTAETLREDVSSAFSSESNPGNTQVASNDSGATPLPVAAEIRTPPVVSYEGLKKIVAVSRFENRSSFQGGGAAYLGTGLSSQLTDSLIQSGAFVVLERETLTDVIGEQDLARSGRVSRSQSARTGKLTAAQILVKGTVTEFQLNTEGSASGVSLMGVTLGGGRSETHIGVIIRLIDTTTGQVLASHRVEGKAQGASSATGLDLGYVGFKSSSKKRDPISKAAQIAIDRAVEFIGAKLKSLPFQGRIVALRKSNVIISAGKRNGAKPGDVFTVQNVGAELKDPLTGEILGREVFDSGKLEITRVQQNFSYARPLGKFKIKVGDFIRYNSGSGA